ncbi:universal stress protein [Pseudomonas aeruginosa]|nr:universal stress protein [Pseudomonas aeruginosa]
MIRHLLVAHDLTPEADVALARAAQLARQHDARVSLLHVYDPGLSASAVKTVSAMLQLKRKEAGLDEDSAIHLFRGQPVDGILQQTRALEPDLLLMGAHHQKTFERFGNTTLDQVVRRSRVPVLLAVREADEPYRQALSALDFPSAPVPRCARPTACCRWKPTCTPCTCSSLPTTACSACPGRMPRTWPPRPG